MISSNNPTLRKLRHPRGQRGQTLVIVLGFVMLMTVLVLAFFASVMTESTSARAASGGEGARQLAQSAVQLVEGIISQATVPGADNTIAWACQPGMIRTYGGGGVASSTPLNYYKLYSNSQMVVSNPNSTGFTPDADIVSNWDTMPSMYTDLNAPITDSTGTLVFPIVDPRAKDAGVAVEGFSYSNSTVPSSKSVDGVSTAGTELLPMPVQWLYVLRDGSMVSPTSATTTSATFGGTTVPTASNPIVGRVAFWTDDECAKVNLNTASEGTYWDTPISSTGKTTDVFTYTSPSSSGAPSGQINALGDAVLASLIPARDEFQRYSGHPATTCLSTVFGSLFTGSPARNTVTTAIDGVTPRISDGSGGTNTSSLGGTTNASTTIQPNFNRLYATVDDFNFSATRSAQSINGASVQTIVQRSRFFLTTASKAPDLNPFGLPKISIWPVWDNANSSNRTTLDNAMIHCSTVANGAIGGSQHSMIFTRDDPTGSTKDWTTTDVNGSPRNQQLYKYLETLTSRPIPGFGGNFTTKYGATDVDQILAEIFDYIRCTNLTDQTTTTSNYTPIANSTTGVGAQGQVVPIQMSGTINGGTPRGMGRIETISEMALVLTKIDDRKNVATADGPANLASSPIMVTTHDTNSPAVTSFDPSTSTCIEWVLIPKMFCGMAGFPDLGNSIKLTFSAFNLSIGGVSVAAPSDAPTIYDTGRIGTSTRDSQIGGDIGCYDLVSYQAAGSLAKPPKDSMYPTGLVVVPKQSAIASGQAPGTVTIPISGGFTVTITTPNATPQTLNFSFGKTTSISVPVPELAYSSGSTWEGAWRTANTYTAPTTSPAAPGKFSYPAAVSSGTAAYNSYRLIGTSFFPQMIAGPNTDVVRSLVATGSITSGGPSIQGDMRVLSLMGTVPDTVFSVDWSNTTGTNPAAPVSNIFAIDSLRESVFQHEVGFGYGSLVLNTPSTSYGTSPPYQPAIPVIPTTSTTNFTPSMTNPADNSSPPDWDNGPAILMDGPYFNKPDEGQGLTKSNSFHNMVYIATYDSVVNQIALQGTGFFSPNRQISSPVMFGSLLVGQDHPWRTLLFRPATLPGYQETTSTSSYTHPGGADPTIPDHLLLDFFRMPVVEPYAISEPLATSGKINLNTQIVPFTYIQRTTGLRAVLKSVMITALNPKPGGTNILGVYKTGYLNSGQTSVSAGNTQLNATTRYAIDLDDTLNQLTTQNDTTTTNTFPEFSRTTYTAQNPNFFISPSQICDVPLIPLSATGTEIYNNGNLGTFWQANGLTGDNSLEKPYTYIYPRVTTQSNTFTVHVRAQSLRKLPAGVENATIWTEGRDQVTGEYRGSFTVEKYFDPSHAIITTASSTTALKDSDDSSIDATAAVRGDDNDGSTNGSGKLQHGALWRLVESKRFGQ